MSKTVKISNISVQIGDRTINLTVEEAKDFKEVLEDIFGKPSEVNVIEKEIYRDFKYPYITWDTKPNIEPSIHRKYEITCDSSNSLLKCKSENNIL